MCPTRILRVPRREKPLHFRGKTLAFSPKKHGLEGQGSPQIDKTRSTYGLQGLFPERHAWAPLWKNRSLLMSWLHRRTIRAKAALRRRAALWHNSPCTQVLKTPKACNLRGHLQRCQMPDIENSRKGCRVGHGKQPKNSRKNSWNTRNSRKAVKTAVFSAVFPAVFRLLYCDPLGTLFGHPFRLFSMSGIWHLCRWPRRLQALAVFSMGVLLPHVGPAWTSQHSELHGNQIKDDLKDHFKDDLAFLKRKIISKMIWHSRRERER